MLSLSHKQHSSGADRTALVRFYSLSRTWCFAVPVYTTPNKTSVWVDWEVNTLCSDAVGSLNPAFPGSSLHPAWLCDTHKLVWAHPPSQPHLFSTVSKIQPKPWLPGTSPAPWGMCRASASSLSSRKRSSSPRGCKFQQAMLHVGLCKAQNLLNLFLPVANAGLAPALIYFSIFPWIFFGYVPPHLSICREWGFSGYNFC